ncbi:hypothetical protein BFJ67_g15701 [Fusarium oxysporum f. sp. cepae]|nr:hypothetical protein BFJ67_g15701 [Fusarium oxysporum f. sp. cepae]
MDQRTEKQVADPPAQNDVDESEENQNPYQHKPKPQSQPQSQSQPQFQTQPQPHNLPSHSETASGTSEAAKRLPPEPNNKPISKLKLTVNNLTMLNRQTKNNASKPGESVCSDVGTHGVNSSLSQEDQLFPPPPPDGVNRIRDDDVTFKTYPSLAKVPKEGCSADVASAALRAMGDCD